MIKCQSSSLHRKQPSLGRRDTHETQVTLTFMWRHQQVDRLLRQAGPHTVYLPLQVDVTQMLCQNPWRRTSKVASVIIPARHDGESGTSPEASLISSAVRIRAMSVEVKWTVLSSAMGMFILTNRWKEQRDKHLFTGRRLLSEGRRSDDVFTGAKAVNGSSYQ